jgi:hypothetical protein
MRRECPATILHSFNDLEGGAAGGDLELHAVCSQAPIGDMYLRASISGRTSLLGRDQEIEEIASSIVLEKRDAPRVNASQAVE